MYGLGVHEDCRKEKEAGSQDLLRTQALDYQVAARVSVRKLADSEHERADHVEVRRIVPAGYEHGGAQKEQHSAYGYERFNKAIVFLIHLSVLLYEQVLIGTVHVITLTCYPLGDRGVVVQVIEQELVALLELGALAQLFLQVAYLAFEHHTLDHAVVTCHKYDDKEQADYNKIFVPGQKSFELYKESVVHKLS